MNKLYRDTVTLYHADAAAQTVVRTVLPMRLRGKPHHVEAGAWWNGSGTGVRSLTR